MPHRHLDHAGMTGQVGGEPLVLGRAGGPVFVVVDLVARAGGLTGRGAGRTGGRPHVRSVGPGRVEDVEARVAVGNGVPAVRVGARVGPVLGRGRVRVVGVGPTRRAGGGRLGPGPQPDGVLPVVALAGEDREPLGLRPVGRAEDVTDLGPPVLQVAVVGLGAAAVSDVTGRDHELGPRRADQGVDGRLVGVQVVGERGARRVEGLPDVAHHVEGQRRRGCHRVEGGELLCRIGAQQVDRAGAERAVAVGGAGRKSGEYHGGLVLVGPRHHVELGSADARRGPGGRVGVGQAGGHRGYLGRAVAQWSPLERPRRRRCGGPVDVGPGLGQVGHIRGTGQGGVEPAEGSHADRRRTGRHGLRNAEGPDRDQGGGGQYQAQKNPHPPPHATVRRPLLRRASAHLHAPHPPGVTQYPIEGSATPGPDSPRVARRGRPPTPCGVRYGARRGRRSPGSSDRGRRGGGAPSAFVLASEPMDDDPRTGLDCNELATGWHSGPLPIETMWWRALFRTELLFAS